MIVLRFFPSSPVVAMRYGDDKVMVLSFLINNK